MEIRSEISSKDLSPLESFLRDYVEVTGGEWDEVEPQVYDLWLADDADSGLLDADDDIVRITFDPEALPEHPNSQLASFGTPLVNRLFDNAARQGQFARAYINGLNLTPHDLPRYVRRAMTLADGLQLEVQRARAMDFPQAVYWFQAMFVSDQKEYQLLPLAMDLHYARCVRHLDRLLSTDHLEQEPQWMLPQIKRCSLAEAYQQAAGQVLRTLSALVNTRRRELAERLERQVTRMSRYYSDLRSELTELEQRAESRGQETDKYHARRAAVDREEQLRIADLRRQNALSVQLRLTNLLMVHQPKLLVSCTLTGPRCPAEPLQLVWDPLAAALEAVPCPACLSPTLQLSTDARHRIRCPACLDK